MSAEPVITMRDPDRAFNEAIELGWLSSDSTYPNFAGNYMYMCTQDGDDFFKHRDTRRSFRVVRSGSPPGELGMSPEL